MFAQVFQAHGQFCASHPWEVLFITITTTISLMSMSYWATNSKVCGWNYYCHTEEQLKTSDEITVMTFIRCLAIMYIYLQFRHLRKIGSKYLLVGGLQSSIFLFQGLAGVFTIFSSFIFSIAIANLIGFDLNGLPEALPFFLLLIDLSKASALARRTLTAANQEELQDDLGQGMAVIGPALTLDSLVKTLIIGVGAISGMAHLETMCGYGCLSVVSNYLAFMTIYPACLSLALEMSGECNQGQPLEQLRQLAKAMQKEEDEKNPNPVTQCVKVIMSAGLVLVHAFRLADTVQSGNTLDAGFALDVRQDHRIKPDIPLWQFYLARLLTAKLNHGLSVLLALGLTIKYIVFDDKVDLQHQQEILQTVQDQIAQKQDNDAPGNSPSSLTQAASTQTTDVGFVAAVGSQTEAVVDGPRGVTSSSSSTIQTAANMPVSECVVARPEVVSSSDMKLSSSLSPPAAFFLGGNPESDTSSEEDMDTGAQHNGTAGVSTVCVGSQTETVDRPPGGDDLSLSSSVMAAQQKPSRPLKECVSILKNDDQSPGNLTDEEIEQLVASSHIRQHQLEDILGNHTRGVRIRNRIVSKKTNNALNTLPIEHYDYTPVTGKTGACCENVVGYLPVPVGVVGPLRLDGCVYHVPMATTEGALVASTNRGCKALELGVKSKVINDGMTRAPCVRFPTACRASEAKEWLETLENFNKVKTWFDSTSRFARLKKLHPIQQVGTKLHIRFVAKTGDAMGMNMMSKGCEKALQHLNEIFPDMEVLSLSGNMCTDKKPAAINWIEGRGKSVVCEAVVKASVVEKQLKTTVAALIDLNISKNLEGSALAGSVGGCNAHAANIVTAIFIATGQDPAQNITSSNCITQLERSRENPEDLRISCTMPSIEVGTVGGGTILAPQSACLDMLGVRGSHPTRPGDNAKCLARVVCATVMAGELNLLAALAAGQLVKSHLKHNRSILSINSKPNDKSLSEKETTDPSICHKKDS